MGTPCGSPSCSCVLPGRSADVTGVLWEGALLNAPPVVALTVEEGRIDLDGAEAADRFAASRAEDTGEVPTRVDGDGAGCGCGEGGRGVLWLLLAGGVVRQRRRTGGRPKSREEVD